MGSTILDLSVAFDVNNDGVVDMILPDEERRLLQAMTFKGGEFKRIAEGPVGAVITTVLWREISTVMARSISYTAGRTAQSKPCFDKSPTCRDEKRTLGIPVCR